MAVGFPTKVTYANGDVYSASDVNDTNGTLNLIAPTAKGDLFAGSAANTYTKLAVGSNDQVLTADSTTATGLKWALAAGGGMTLLSTTTLSGATTTISSINQTYNYLYGVIYGVTNATADGNLRVRANGSTTVGNIIKIASDTTVNAQEGSDISINNTAQQPDRTSANNVWAFQIQNYTSTSRWKGFSFNGVYERSGANPTPIYGGGGFSTNSAITSLVFSQSGGTFSSGTVLLYGVK